MPPRVLSVQCGASRLDVSSHGATVALAATGTVTAAVAVPISTVTELVTDPTGRRSGSAQERSDQAAAMTRRWKLPV